MLLFLKKKPDDTGAAAEVRDLHEFVPCHSHYDAKTLLTRNGELMQTVRITCNNDGFTYENSGDGETLRDHIRQAIVGAVTTDQYALWVHTFRKRRIVHYDSRVDNPFAAHVHEAWQQKRHWKYQYYNEIYLTVLHEGQSGSLLDKATFKSVFLPMRNRRYRNAYLDQAAVELNDVVATIVARIRQKYRAEPLSIVERSGNAEVSSIFYSEPLEFLNQLVNLKDAPVPVRELEIGKIIAGDPIVFGFNALEAKNGGGGKRYGAIVSLKQYREITPEAVDRLLQAPLEFTLTQAFSFTSAARALKGYKAQKELFEISGDSYSAIHSGLDDMIKADHGQLVDFGNLQTTVMVITDDYRHLDDEIHKVQDAFADMGLLTVREDVKLEECFWSQLPGNFSFIRRKDIVATPSIAGFCRLNLFSGGRDTGNHWGEALALMPTTVGSPYFFNFHQKDNGHTALFDFNSFRDPNGRVLLNFLLTSAFKHRTRLCVFDRRRSSRLWFDKINGAYHRLPVAPRRTMANALRLNPFTLPDSPRNRAFLLAWLQALLESVTAADDAHREVLAESIRQLYEQPPENRHLLTLIDFIAAADYHLAIAFAPFHGDGKFSGLFDGVEDTLDLAQPWHAFDMDAVLKHPAYAVPVFAYLMHRIVASLDGKPVILVLHEAWDLLENSFIAPRLESLLEMLKQNNVMMICATERPDAQVGKSSFAAFLKNAATLLYLPDDMALDYAGLIPGLSAHDAALLTHMDRQRGDFLLKSGEESIGLSANFDDMDDVRAIFANDVKTLIAAGGPFASLPRAYGHDEDPA